MEWLGPALVNMGGIGVVSLIGIVVIRHLYLRVEELQDLRIEEMKANLAATTANTAALTANTQSTNNNNQKIDALLSSNQSMMSLLQQLALKGG